MKQLFLSFATAAALIAGSFSAAATEPVTLYGLKLYCESGGLNGVYSLRATADAQPEIYWADGDMIANGGVVYTNDKLYVLSYLDFFGMLMWGYQVCDFENKTYEYLNPELEVKDAGSAMTYDPATGNVYSICIDADDYEKFTLSTMNLADGSKTPVASISERMCAMACTAAGTLYGIGMDGNLYTINKATAELTKIGATGVIPENDQSAVIDYATNVMYWSAYTADGGFLYTVDITTGQATLLSTFDDKFQLVGLFIKQTATVAGAPGAPTELSTNFEGASLSGTISFKAPDTDVDGNPLQGELTYSVKLIDTELATGTVNAGEMATANVTVPATGNHTFSVSLANTAGASRSENISLWVGYDTPPAVTDCLVSETDGQLNLTWTLPERGINGGFVDPALTRYVIVRGPYAQTVAEAHEGTEFSEPYSGTGINPIIYSVTPVLEGLTGETTLSNTIIVGGPATVPYAEDFADPFRSLLFTAFDLNEDDCTWVYDFDKNSMYCDWAIETENDDWLVSSPIKLEADKTYAIHVTARSEGKWNNDNECYDDVYSGTLGAYLGTECAPAALTQNVIEPFDVIHKDFEVYSAPKVNVEADGIYHLGLHLTGIRSIYNTYLQKIEIVEAEKDGINAPSAAGTLTVTAAGNQLIITNPAGLTVNVYRTDGTLAATTSQTTAVLTPGQGLYIVVAPGHTAKVVLQ